MFRNLTLRYLFLAVGVVALLSSCGRKKYDNIIASDTQQPDKVLFDRAINDIERSRYEIARLTLQTLINTYDTSEFLAKSKLAIADSWMREGGTYALAQAEAEYKDFILFYPSMEEAAEAQDKVCQIHFRQMEKPDRDPQHALRAEDECRQVLLRFPNSRFAPTAQQRLREIQEVIAEGEYRAGAFYFTKGSFPAAANRFQALVDQYPLYSAADEALWKLGDAYSRFGDRFEDRAANVFTRIVREYPLSARAEEAKQRLTAMNRPVPEADPVAYARMKYELENREEAGMMSHLWGMFRKSPDVRAAAKSGSPAMTSLRPSIPVSVPPATAGATGVSADVTVAPVTDSTALDTQPDARQNPPAPEAAAPAAPQLELGVQPSLPSNRQPVPAKKNPSGNQDQKNDSKK
jgi:outer membrane protein assembly factor BamD